MSGEPGEKFAEIASRGEFEALADLFAPGIVFIAAAPASPWHAEGLARATRAMREIFPGSEKITAVTALRHHEIPGRFRIRWRMRRD